MARRICNNSQKLIIGLAAYQSAKFCFYTVSTKQEFNQVIKGKICNAGFFSNLVEQVNVVYVITDRLNFSKVISINIINYARNALKCFIGSRYFCRTQESKFIQYWFENSLERLFGNVSGFCLVCQELLLVCSRQLSVYVNYFGLSLCMCNCCR
ncbi:hypothetical protein D3C75_935340 [compost metagenome]